MPIAALISRSWITASSSLPCRVRVSTQVSAAPTRIATSDQQSVVDRVRQAADVEIAEQAVRLVRGIRLDAPDQLDHVLEDQKHGVGDEHQHDLVLAVHEAQQAALDQRSRDEADENGGERPAARSCRRE